MKRLALFRPLATLASLAMLAPLPAAAQDAAVRPPTLEQQLLLRCSAATALLSAWQDQDRAPAGLAPLDKERAREFFVRAMARLMDERGLTREEVSAQLFAQAATFDADPASLAAIMPACRDAMELSGS